MTMKLTEMWELTLLLEEVEEYFDRVLRCEVPLDHQKVKEYSLRLKEHVKINAPTSNHIN